MLNGKQKRLFRAQANQIKATVTVGKVGVTEQVKKFIDQAFNNKELVKVRILDTSPADCRQVAGELSELENTEVVQVLGRTVLLYRPLPDEKE